MIEPTGIETLLDLDGSILDQGDGYWVKITAWRVEAGADIPHGIRYSLTLHDRHATRLLGFDNAHQVRPPKGFKYAGRKLPFDHRHRHEGDVGVPYLFQDAYHLLKDFFEDVDRLLKEISAP